MTDLTRRRALATGSALAAAAMLPRPRPVCQGGSPVRLTSVKVRLGELDYRHHSLPKASTRSMTSISRSSKSPTTRRLPWRCSPATLTSSSATGRGRCDSERGAATLSLRPILRRSAASWSRRIARSSRSPILKGKKIGVAGTGIDKSWILLRAYSRKLLGKGHRQFRRARLRCCAPRHRRIQERTPRRRSELLDLRGAAQGRWRASDLDDGRRHQGHGQSRRRRRSSASSGREGRSRQRRSGRHPAGGRQ